MSNYKYVSNLRVMLYRVFYSDSTNMQYIINSILTNFDLFSITYNANNNSIELKIKKTNIRKNSSFSHTSSYYYEIFNPIFHSIFVNNIDLLKNLINTTKDTYGLAGTELEFLSNSNNMPLLFNITTISDNIVVIYL